VHGDGRGGKRDGCDTGTLGAGRRQDRPTQGMTHEHVFPPDGTVEWHTVAEHQAPAEPSKKGAEGATAERPP
jgi:hypothetical protein